MNPKVDFYFDKAVQWQDETRELRAIALDCHLGEVLKWGCPCYTFQDRNIVLIHTFKEYCALLFFKGALLKDPNGVLVQQTKNVQSSRQLRFTSLAQIKKMARTIRAFILEAVEVEEAGLKVDLKPTAAYSVPEEFQTVLDSDAALRAAFEALTPGRQRGYMLHFSAPKQSKTRTARIEKSRALILEGKGLND